MLLVGLAIVAVSSPFLLTYVLGSSWWHASEHTCGEHDLGCGLTIHVVGTALVAALAYYVLFLRREARAANAWRSEVKKAPQDLFPWLPPLHGLTGMPTQPVSLSKGTATAESRARVRRPGASQEKPLVATIVARDALIGEICDDLDDGAGPQVLVGSTGSGKTMVLLRLAHYLARHGQVPVAVSLRGRATIDFEELASNTYHRNSRIHNRDEAEKHWQWLRRRHHITVLADDLEKAKASPADRVRAIEAAASQHLRLVVASRPDGVPADFRQGRIDLGPLSRQSVLDYLADLAKEVSPNGDNRADAIEQMVDAAEITRTPYYLSMVHELIRTGELPEPSRDEDARLALLSAYRKAIEGGHLARDAGLSKAAREKVFDRLEVVAFARLQGAKRIKDLVAKTEEYAPADGGVDTSAALDGAQRLSVLRRLYDDDVHFGHPTTLAYFASRFLGARSEDRSLWQQLLAERPITPAVVLAITFANAGAPDPGLAKATCDALLERAAVRNGGAASPPTYYERMALVGAAADIARYVPADARAKVASTIVTEARALRSAPPALSQEKTRLIKSVSRVDDACVCDALWDYATSADQEYAVRRQAVSLLTEAGPSTLERVLPRIESAIAQGDAMASRTSGPDPDDRGTTFDALRAVAWLLPSMRTASGAKPEIAERAAELQQRLMALAPRLTKQRGLEASIAQGLKLDAVTSPGAPLDPLAERMSSGAEFWFSRVLALQAASIRLVEGDRATRPPGFLLAARSDPHPFVRNTSELCVTAFKRREWRSHIWEDMDAVAAGRPHGLVHDATRLLGDVALLLNLNEQGDAAEREAFGRAHELPFCLSESRDRDEILGGRTAPLSCALRGPNGVCRCPYVDDFGRTRVRRELSRAFCRYQRLTAQRIPWQPALRREGVKRFWRRMEDLARF